MIKRYAVVLGLMLAAGMAAQVHAQSAGLPADGGGMDPLFKKWDFAGTDSSGVAWRGTLTIGELDPKRFDPNPAKYNHMCELKLQSASKDRGVETTCLYDPQTRTLSFGGGGFSNKYSYTAVLSPDGKSLIQGRWAAGNSETGVWSASVSGAGSGATDAPAAPALSGGAAARVTAVRLRLVPESYEGPCPSHVQLVGDITTSGPGTVWYQFLAGAVRKSGPAENTVNFSAGGTQTVTLEAEYVSTPGSPHTSLLAAMVDGQGRHGPQNMSSGPVNYNATCTGRAPATPQR